MDSASSEIEGISWHLRIAPMLPTKRMSRQLVTVHHAAFKWSIRSMFGSLKRRIWEGAILAAYSRDRKCLPSFLFSSSTSADHVSYSVADFADYEKVRIEIRLKGYVLLADQTKTTRLSAQTSTGTSIIIESIAKGIEEFSSRYEIAFNWICDRVCRK